jgi:hypothetical protein
MAVDVLRPNEVLLNSIRYPITGKVQPTLVSQQPQRMVTGTFGKANNPLVDTLILDDFRAGILVEHDLGEPRQAWWSTADIRFPNSMVLPPLATAVSMAHTGGSWTTPTSGSGTSWVNPTYAYDENTGTGATYDIGVSSWSGYMTFVAPSASMVNHQCRVWAGRGTTDITTMQVDYYIPATATWVNCYNTTPTYGSYVTIPFGVTQVISQVRVRFYNASGASDRVVTIYEFDFCDDDITISTLGKPVNFNSKLYWSAGTYLFKLNATGNGFTPIYIFPAAITDLVPSVTSNLYIFLGAAAAYWWMNTAEAVATTDQLYSVIGTHWDAKLYAFNTATGQLYYEATPATASPGYTSDALLDLNASTAQRIITYRDAYYGNPVIYLSSKAGLWVHDATDHIWLESELVLPEGATTGKGLVVWQSDLYLSSGLSVAKYRAGSQAAIDTKVGLDQFDGVPSEYRGEIVNLIKGFGEMYALVDSSQSTGVGTSWVAAYDGYGWRPIWIDSATDQALQDGVVSSDYAYRLWWGANNVPTYINLARDAQNPKKNSAYTYATAGAFITPWYTGQWEGGVSRALALKVECADMTATETITVQYRIDHATTALDATWTTLGTAIVANGQTTFKFPNATSPAGTVFRAIQFRLDFARGATTTASPVLRYMVFEFQKVIPTAWGWSFQIDCTKVYDGKSPAQLLDAVLTAAATTTLVPFVYDDETNYVEVVNVSGDRQTGETREGIYNVQVRAPQ